MSKKIVRKAAKAVKKMKRRVRKMEDEGAVEKVPETGTAEVTSKSVGDGNEKTSMLRTLLTGIGAKPPMPPKSAKVVEDEGVKFIHSANSIRCPKESPWWDPKLKLCFIQNDAKKTRQYRPKR